MDKVHFSSQTDMWATPQALFDELAREFGPFDLDVCATAENAKCKAFFSPEVDGLKQSWITPFSAGKTKCWMNPPYGRQIGRWVAKAKIESDLGSMVVCLLPARTDTAWFHDFIWGGLEGRVSVRFLRGRVKFGDAKVGAPFPSVVVVFHPPKR